MLCFGEDKTSGAQCPVPCRNPSFPYVLSLSLSRALGEIGLLEEIWKTGGTPRLTWPTLAVFVLVLLGMLRTPRNTLPSASSIITRYTTHASTTLYLSMHSTHCGSTPHHIPDRAQTDEARQVR